VASTRVPDEAPRQCRDYDVPALASISSAESVL
jgi:hypothetical protein